MKQTVLLFLAVGTAALAQTADAPADPTGAGHSPRSSAEEPFSLRLPLQCEPGTSCWVANYVDVDPGPAARDYQCGARSYDGHDGVDFAIRDLGVMAAGVPVIASAPGKVKNVRDGMEDTGLNSDGAESALQGRECGNGVVIKHRGGWQTQYCHLRKGSVAVKPGDSVDTGTVLGDVGMSGWAEFPHVHLAVRHKGVKLDPFSGLAIGAACGTSPAAMWTKETGLGYEPAALYNGGFSAGPPDIDRIRAGEDSAAGISAQSSAMVLWADMFGVAQGDRVQFTITGPSGEEIISQEQQIEKTQARRYMYIGKRRATAAWPSGTYTGRIALSRPQANGAPWQTTLERQVTVH